MGNTLTKGTMFPVELTNEMFNLVKGHSSLAKLAASEPVPFNGTGHSGMGAYHGEWGFREFTHPSTVLTGSTRFNLPLREHPYEKHESIKRRMLQIFEK